MWIAEDARFIGSFSGVTPPYTIMITLDYWRNIFKHLKSQTFHYGSIVRLIYLEADLKYSLSVNLEIKKEHHIRNSKYRHRIKLIHRFPPDVCSPVGWSLNCDWLTKAITSYESFISVIYHLLGFCGTQSQERKAGLGVRYELSFKVSGPTTWNDLPARLKDSSLSKNSFRKLLKAFSFDRWPLHLRICGVY